MSTTTKPVTKNKTNKTPKKLPFNIGDYVVYPAHGAGEITNIITESIAGFECENYVIHLFQEKMILRIPTAKSQTNGMRNLVDKASLDKALNVICGRARVKRTMWSRRAQEYEAKINSGDLILLAEVVRDLHRTHTQPEQSYSERQLYERALDRMAREVALVNETNQAQAQDLITHIMDDVRSKTDEENDAQEAMTADTAETDSMKTQENTKADNDN